MSVTAPRGFKASGVKAGIKLSGQLDLALLVSELPASVAAAFTSNRILGAPLTVSKPRVAKGMARGVIVSSGIANVATGEEGIADAVLMAKLAADACGVPEEEMLVSATGVIGHRIPMDPIRKAIPVAAEALSVDGGDAAALAILTTDARPKTAARRIDIDGTTVTIGAMAKGAGMIAPRMELHATLLVFITTDAACSPGSLRSALGASLPGSFNSISVDGCMSTSDTVLIFANGASGVSVDDDPRFAEALDEIMQELAYAMVRDGEGASRVIRTTVRGAASQEQAAAAAREIGTSLLVRCAVAGGDPNWGRIAQALGQTPGIWFDPADLSIHVAGVPVASKGAHTGREAEAAEAMRSAIDVEISVDLSAGDAAWSFLSSDLTPEYVTFNAEYTT